MSGLLGYGLIIIALILIAFGNLFKRVAFMLCAGGFWIAAGVTFYSLSTTLWDIYFIIFWFCIAMAIITMMLSMVVREKKDVSEGESQLGQDDAYFAEQHERQIAHQKRLAQYDDLTGGRRKKPSVWDKLKD